MTQEQKIDAILDLTLVTFDATLALYNAAQAMITTISVKDARMLSMLMHIFNDLTHNKGEMLNIQKMIKELGLYDTGEKSSKRD